MMSAEAYLNHGRWVVECPEPGCHDARMAHRMDPVSGLPTTERLESETCANRHTFRVVLPPERLAAQIMAAVGERPNEADRSWYPRDHPRAVLSGQPHGQTVAELVEENEEVAAVRAAEQARKDETLRAVLAQHGIEVRPDGSFEGSL